MSYAEGMSYSSSCDYSIVLFLDTIYIRMSTWIRDNLKTIVVTIPLLLFLGMAGYFLIVKSDNEDAGSQVVLSSDSSQASPDGLSTGSSDGLGGQGAAAGLTNKSLAADPTVLPPVSKESSPANQSSQEQVQIPSQTLDNGLKIEQYQAGSGDRASKVGDIIGVNYIGYFTDGTVFDTNLKGEKKPFGFKLGTGQVIQGWDMGLQNMKVNEIRRLHVPAALAYGANGSPPTIPPNTELVFDVQMLGFGE